MEYSLDCISVFVQGTKFSNSTLTLLYTCLRHYLSPISGIFTCWRVLQKLFSISFYCEDCTITVGGTKLNKLSKVFSVTERWLSILCSRVHYFALSSTNYGYFPGRIHQFVADFQGLLSNSLRIQSNLLTL